MELLLLDTTEREGEDNKLYHFCTPVTAHTGYTDTRRLASTWRGLRGVLAAAVGTAASVCGEPLQCAHFSSGTSTNAATSKHTGANEDSDVVGFVNLNEVLYVLAFPATANVPIALVQYYTRSSCDLLLSLFGYPDAKLCEWTRGSQDTAGALTERLDVFFTAVFATIKRDLAGGTHVQFAFNGRVPVVHYPLSVLAELAAPEPLQMCDELLNTATIAGRCIRFRKCIVLSTIRPDVLRLVNQWLLSPSKSFYPHTSFASTTALDGYRVATFELHDFRFARHGFYPKRHTLLLLERGDLQVLYLVERSLAAGCDTDKPISRALVESLSQPTLAQLERIATSKLLAYLDRMRIARARVASTVLDEQLVSGAGLTTVAPPSSLPSSTSRKAPSRFQSYWIVHDLLRDTIIGEDFYECVNCPVHQHHSDSLCHASASPAVATASSATLAAIFSLFVERIAVFQQSPAGVEWPDPSGTGSFASINATSPDVCTWVAPLQLDVNDPDTLFLHDARSDAGADISCEDAHIFPPRGESLFTASKTHARSHTLLHERLVHQEAESHIVAVGDGSGRHQRLWVVANYYETVRLFAVFDADAVSLETIERKMDDMCAFGAYTK